MCMKRKSNIFLYTVLALTIFQNVFFGITFADEEAECYVCSRMSNEMQMYVNFQVEMIGALSQVSNEREIFSGLTKRWLFSYGALNVGANLLNSLKNSINKTTQSAVDTARAFEYAAAIAMKNAWTLAFSAEWVWDILVLFRQKPFMRDWNTLLEIDGNIDDLLRDVWMQGMLKKNVSEEIMSNLNEISEKYTEADPVFSKFHINGNASYIDLVMMLSDVNTVMKNFFTVESMFVYQEKINSFEKEMSEWDSVDISFNPEYLIKLSESYACVKGKAWFKNCGWSLQNFASDVSHIWTDVKTQFENAWKEIKESSKKLAEVSKSVWKVMKKKYTNGWDLWLTDDQVELLWEIYGINVSKLTKQQWLSLATILNWTAWKNLKNSVSISSDLFGSQITSQKKESGKQSAAETTNDSITDSDFNKLSSYLKQKSCLKKLNKKWISDADKVKWKQNCLNKLWENSVVLKDNIDSYIEYYVPDGRVDDFTNMVEYLNDSIENTLSELDLDKAIVMYSQNLDATRYFVEIWAYIHGIVNNVIWSKNWSSKTIVNNLGKACEAQCSNKWWKCYN